MAHEKKFKTKEGYCYILPDKVAFTREEKIEDITKLSGRNTIRRLRLRYAIFSFAFLLLAYYFTSAQQYVVAGVFILLAFIYFYVAISSSRFSNVQVIERSKIKHVKFKQGQRYFTRARLEIFFEEKPKIIKKRVVDLYGSKGIYETETALKTMKDAGLME